MQDLSLEEVLTLLRNQLVPSLRLYRVENIEISYGIDSGKHCAVQGIQIRDGAGTRIPRGQLPLTVTEQMESLVSLFLCKAQLSSGDGVIGLCLGKREIVCNHQPLDEKARNIQRSWRL